MGAGLKWPEEGQPARLVVPMDGSSEAANALGAALRIARGSGAEVLALHVAKAGLITRRHPIAACRLTDFASHGEDDAEEARLAMLPAPVWGRAAGVRVELLASRGRPAESIVACAQAHAATMIIMGTHGASARSSASTFGSVARAVYGAWKRPTVVVPPKGVRDAALLASSFAAPAEGSLAGPKVIAAIDGGPGTAEVVAASVELARRTRGALRLFSGAPGYPGADAPAAVGAAQAAALAALVQFKVDTGAPDALAGLTGLSEQDPDAVIVVGARAAPGRAPGEVGSFTAKLLASASCAVAVVPVGA